MGNWIKWAALSIVVAAATGCGQKAPEEKIDFDIEILNEDGLYGPVGGLRTLQYEYCIPAGKGARDDVAAIDPSANCTGGLGRIDCQIGEFMCVGHTKQDGHKRILIELARLEYVDRIQQTYFE